SVTSSVTAEPNSVTSSVTAGEKSVTRSDQSVTPWPDGDDDLAARPAAIAAPDLDHSSADAPAQSPGVPLADTAAFELAPLRPAADDSGSHPNEALRVPYDAIEVAVPQSTRRFLEPLVGIDPASVNVYQAPHGAPATRGADAVTLGEDVVLAAGQAGSSPDALGLLAHELTH